MSECKNRESFEEFKSFLFCYADEVNFILEDLAKGLKEIADNTNDFDSEDAELVFNFCDVLYKKINFMSEKLENCKSVLEYIVD